MQLTLQTTARLNNGVEMPYLGLGVYQAATGRETREAVRHALEVGYRHIDTARIYDNEKDVGQAVRESGLSREQVFVTTKLWYDDVGYDRTLRAFAASLKRLQLDYVDLYLIHWPMGGNRLDTWRAMVKLQQDGLCRAVGVSNFTIGHLRELLDAEQVPAVNQVEFSPFLYQRELHGFCREHGIQLEAYRPLTRGTRFDHPVIQSVARKHGRSPAQVMIRWLLEHRIVAIPKSARPERIRENAQALDFSLDAADMQQLDALNEDYRTCWDPTEVP